MSRHENGWKHEEKFEENVWGVFEDVLLDFLVEKLIFMKQLGEESSRRG